MTNYLLSLLIKAMRHHQKNPWYQARGHERVDNVLIERFKELLKETFYGKG